jgi:hypothetical protein
VLCGIAKLEAELEHVSVEVVDILWVEVRGRRTSKGPESLRPVDLDFERLQAGEGQVELRDLFGQGIDSLVVVLVDRSSRDVESEVLQLLMREHRIDRWEHASIEAIDVHAASVGAYKHVQSGCDELDGKAEGLDDGVVAHLVLPVGDTLATIFVVFELLFHPFEGMVVVVESALVGRGVSGGRGGMILVHEVDPGDRIQEPFGYPFEWIIAGDGLICSKQGGIGLTLDPEQRRVDLLEVRANTCVEEPGNHWRSHDYSLVCCEIFRRRWVVAGFATACRDSRCPCVAGVKHGPLCICVPNDLIDWKGECH